MATLQDIINNNKTLNRSQLKVDKGLVIEIQTKLANLGFYPGGGWIDGDLGGLSSFSWLGFIDFCKKIGSLPIPSDTLAINQEIAQKLLTTKQADSVLKAANQSSILTRLQQIQASSPIVNKNTPSSAFVSRSIEQSPLRQFIVNYPNFLTQKPDGTSLISYGDSFTLSDGRTVNFNDYPNCGSQPNIDNNGLNFLPSNISHACLCIGSFTDSNSPIKARWLGKDALTPVTLWWSTTKFIGVLNTVCQIHQNSINTDIDDCVIESPKNRFNDLVRDMVSYQGLSSNRIGALFKSFSKREVLSKWIETQTGSSNLNFTGSYGEDPLISPARIKDTTTGNIVLSSGSVGAATSTNSLSAYDLARLISMLGWHLHLPNNAKLPSAQWKSLESIVRAMGHDTARYVDVAFETLGVMNIISEPVIISKVGWGNVSATSGSMTYTVFVKFVDRRFTPAKLRTFALALRCPSPVSADFDGRDTNLAAAVTEIVRRILTEELA
ncbi:MAG: hypothetical protein GPJ25_01175 [Microcystis aeruginosa LE13-04]|nr:hypothetical protein [Microcystis aeruginosa LE13-04]